jgi:hypothetical protein
MSATAKHHTEGQDSSLQAVNALATLDIRDLSFVQLKRLLKALQQACADVEAESVRRAEEENSGDTVTVPLSEN